MADTVADPSQPWYRSLNATQWKTLFASNLGWMFDGYETFALILTVGVALRSLLDPSQYPQIPAYAGTVIAITLLGWGVGGLIGGILADYIGRRRMMIYAILAYSLMTGLSALAWDWMSFAALRFLVGVAIGSEWSTGASMTAEVWPNHARGKGAGLMQCGLGIGFFLASFVWLFIGAIGPDAWRIMFLLGILPAFVALWVRFGIPESGLWEQTDRQRRAALDRQRSGAQLAEHEQTHRTGKICRAFTRKGAAMTIDLGDQRVRRLVAASGDATQLFPESLFQGHAGTMSPERDGPLADGRFGRAASGAGHALFRTAAATVAEARGDRRDAGAESART